MYVFLLLPGTFVFVEASKPAESNDRTVMASPNLPDSYRCLRFWVHMFGEKFGSLNVQFSTTPSINRSVEIPVLNGDYGNRWKYVEADVDVTNVFRVRNILVLLIFSCIQFLTWSGALMKLQNQVTDHM